MNKPQLAIESEPCCDYSLAERVARELEQSQLHVFDAYGFMSLPEAIGDPNDATLSVSQELTMLTDGKRGWLILAPAEEDYDVEVEIGDLVGHFLEQIAEPPRWTARAVVTWCRRPGALQFAGCAFEAEYERIFADGRASPDLEALLASIRECGWSVKDELEVRQDMNRSMSLVEDDSAPMISASWGAK